MSHKCHICAKPALMDEYLGKEPVCCTICLEPCCNDCLDQDADFFEGAWVDESACTKCIDNPNWSTE